MTLAGALSGSSPLTKSGSGLLAITGTGSLSGATTVTAGTLKLNGSIAPSGVTVQAGATLAGGGTVGAISLQPGGTLAPPCGPPPRPGRSAAGAAEPPRHRTTGDQPLQRLSAVCYAPMEGKAVRGVPSALMVRTVFDPLPSGHEAGRGGGPHGGASP